MNGSNIARINMLSYLRGHDVRRKVQAGSRQGRYVPFRSALWERNETGPWGGNFNTRLLQEYLLILLNHMF